MKNLAHFWEFRITVVPVMNDPLISDQTPICDQGPPALTFFLSKCTLISDHTPKRDQRPLIFPISAELRLSNDHLPKIR